MTGQHNFAVCVLNVAKKIISTDDTQRFDLSVKLLKQKMKGLWKEHNTARKLEYIYCQGAIPCNLLFPRNNIPVQNSQETHLESGIFYQALRPRDQLFISAGIKINLVKHI